MSETAREPRISVIIPSFNAEATIQETIQSVLCQPADVEVIVQDGGSTDHTLDLLGADTRIKVESAPDSGQSQALNRGIARATGDIIGWLNADDLYADSALRHVAVVFRDRPDIDVVFGDFQIIRGDGSEVRRYILDDSSWNRVFENGCRSWTGSTFWKRDVFERFGSFDENLHYCMDFEFALRIERGTRAVHVPHVLGNFRIHEGSKSGATPFRFITEARSIRNKYCDGSMRQRIVLNYMAVRSLTYLCTRRLWLSRTWSGLRATKHT